jgi:hypothetical protein
MVAFSDISADDQFKMYPAERLFRAVNSAMDYQPMLEAPASRARLKAVVGQLLAQNDRASLADITAMDAAMRHSKGYSDNPANKLPEIASAAESKAPGLSAIEPQKIRFRTDWTDQIPETRLSKLRELDNDLMAISEKEDPAAIRAALDAQRAEREADIARYEEAERVSAENEAEKQEKTKQRVDAFKTTQERKETIDRLNSAAGGEVVGLVDKLISEHTQEELEAAAKSGKPAQTIGLLGDASKRGYKLVFDKDGNMQIEVPASIAQKATPTNTTGNTPTSTTGNTPTSTTGNTPTSTTGNTPTVEQTPSSTKSTKTTEAYTPGNEFLRHSESTIDTKDKNLLRKYPTEHLRDVWAPGFLTWIGNEVAGSADPKATIHEHINEEHNRYLLQRTEEELPETYNYIMGVLAMYGEENDPQA